MSPAPLYTPKEVPRIKNAKRLTATRTKQLVRAAERAYDDPPPPPGLGECCGSSCDPCVNDLWKEELACWRERWGEGAIENKEEQKPRMPGSFDCDDESTHTGAFCRPDEQKLALELGLAGAAIGADHSIVYLASGGQSLGIGP
ncbi:hypothetical protein N8T08_008928 [Aspergillus melleus]|uniref:Uncharacterized protein n=1 Tax=Aspergillus melleus TaxID=138277 RepID=A0ACC3AV51_9EURO|nr:hypothetical protein N8T08_008928 [Aspergillus melleus]